MEDLDMAHPTFAAPDLTTFIGLAQLGLTTTGQHLTPKAATLECRLTEPDPWCTSCSAMGTSRGTISRRLTKIPYGHRSATLLLRVRWYMCTGCGRFWQEGNRTVAPPRVKLTRTVLDWALRALVIDHLSLNRVAGIRGLSWNTVNSAILTEGQYRLIQDTTRFDLVTTLRVDEHVRRHTAHGDKYTT
ncbi:hypothetical protein [Rothia kristinae]|uniref:hypothetical protein n=1 Tax=Rothia kristinae TaxID=37923 RepID=UPI00244834F5|nr:hypothetical protein [Rothia kristinae]WGH09980.1 hypothetical protein OU799_03485 [Rothia kristinae]